MTISAQTQTICLKCFGKGYNIVGTGNSSHPTKEVKCAQCNGYGTSDGRPKQERIYGSFDDEMAVKITRWLQTNQVPSMITCYGCNGSGVCPMCKGTGYTYDRMGAMPCRKCGTRKICTTCVGTKQVQGMRQMTAEERRVYQQWMNDYMKRKAGQ